jgi:hypothetical protein
MNEGRLYEFRIEYTSENSVGHNYHYYLAHDAGEALNYQMNMMNHKHWDIQLLKLERKCPFSNKWIDESSILLENSHEQ